MNRRQRMHGTSVPESVEALFQLCRSDVSRDDIVAFAPDDLGYSDYVSLWSEIHRNGIIPDELHFDLCEVICMTGFADAASWGDRVQRFLVFRRFTSAVAMMLIHRGHELDHVRTTNYLARDLIIDRMDYCNLYDKRPLYPLRQALLDTRRLLKSFNDEQFPFFALASMIHTQLDGDWTAAEQSASQLISDEQEARGFQMCDLPTEFLFGLTHVFNRYNHDWHRMIAGLRNPNHHADTAMVIEALRQT